MKQLFTLLSHNAHNVFLSVCGYLLRQKLTKPDLTVTFNLVYTDDK